jgi:uncharacterized protein (TIGR02145 family)
LIAIAAVLSFSACDEVVQNIIDHLHDEGVEISGTKWATRNVGYPNWFSDSEDDAGRFFQWGANVGWSLKDPLISTSNATVWPTTPTADDAWTVSTNPCPSGWKVPSRSEWHTLFQQSHTYVTSPMRGILFAGTLFIPIVGVRNYADGALIETSGTVYASAYWASEDIAGTDAAYAVALASDNVLYENIPASRTVGYLLRCVEK